MKAYQSKFVKIPGTNYLEIGKKARAVYKRISSKSKRRPYIRSAYFKKDKIFLGLFWHHLEDKLNFRDKVRRLRYFACAIDLIQNSKFEPSTRQDPNKPNELLHRFTGITKDNEVFRVQIKEDRSSDQKFLLSVYPEP